MILYAAKETVKANGETEYFSSADKFRELLFKRYP